MDALGLAVLAFVFGAGVALAARSFFAGPSPRELELQEELDRERLRFSTHREAVEKHFEQTGQLFQDLSYRHAVLFRHLSEGARELCDRPNLLATGLNKGLPGLELAVGPTPEPVVTLSEPAPTAPPANA